MHRRYLLENTLRHIELILVYLDVEAWQHKQRVSTLKEQHMSDVVVVHQHHQLHRTSQAMQFVFMLETIQTGHQRIVLEYQLLAFHFPVVIVFAISKKR